MRFKPQRKGPFNPNFTTSASRDERGGPMMKRKLTRNEEGATAIEYGLIVALIAIGLIVSLQSMGTDLSATFNTVSTSF